MSAGWTLFRVGEQHYGIQTSSVLEMLVLGEVAAVPGTPAHVRGVINLRGVIIPVIDLRRRMGLPSTLDEVGQTVAMLELREQDHVNWLKELIASVEEERAFTLTTDSHACAFGRWYDRYSSDNIALNMQLRKFRRPHAAIHEIAIKAGELMSKGQRDAARALVEETREGELQAMRCLFAEARQILVDSVRETVIICIKNDRRTGLVVDEATETRDVGELQTESCEFDCQGALSRCVHGFAQIGRNTAILLDVNRV